MYLAPTRMLAAARARAREQRGFTLIELLVALVAGLVVSAATMALLITSLNLTSNYTDRVDSNQQGRLAMQRITQALNASCMGHIQPVLTASTATSLSFYSAPQGNDGPVLIPNKDTVTYNGTPTTSGSLVLTTQPQAGTSPNYTNNGPAQNSTLLPWSLPAGPSGSTPVFQYFGYASDGTPTLAIAPGSGGLTFAQTQQVVMVTINFLALPSDNWNAAGRSPAAFNDSVVLRLTPASSAANASNAPCE